METPDPKKWPELYGDYLYNFARLRISDEEAARDLVQDTFLSAIRNLSGFRGEASEKTWLVSIIKRKVIDYYRKASNRLEVSEQSQPEGVEYDYFFETAEEGGREGHWRNERVPKEWNSVSFNLENKEFNKIMMACMDKLPEKWRGAMSLKLFEEQEAEEICKELNISPSNYWVILHRARLQLRECLEKNWFGK